MENRPTTNVTEENERLVLTTDSLGIAEAKAKDMEGFILKSTDIENAVVKTLLMLAIPADAIRCVKVGGTDNNEPKIIVELWKFLLPKKKPEPRYKSKLFDFSDYDDDDEDGDLPKSFYAALRNKAYSGKHLDINYVTRRYHKNDKKCLHFEFDPEIFIAFAYNIPFINRYYKVKAINFPDLPSNFSDLSKQDREKAKNYANNLRKFGIHNCEIIVTYSTSTIIRDENGEKHEVKGFNPDHVELFYKKNNKNNKKKKNN